MTVASVAVIPVQAGRVVLLAALVVKAVIDCRSAGWTGEIGRAEAAIAISLALCVYTCIIVYMYINNIISSIGSEERISTRHNLSHDKSTCSRSPLNKIWYFIFYVLSFFLLFSFSFFLYSKKQIHTNTHILTKTHSLTHKHTHTHSHPHTHTHSHTHTHTHTHTRQVAPLRQGCNS